MGLAKSSIYLDACIAIYLVEESSTFAASRTFARQEYLDFLDCHRKGFKSGRRAALPDCE